MPPDFHYGLLESGAARGPTSRAALGGAPMHRRSFVRLLAAAPLAGAFQNPPGIPALRVESTYAPAATPGMPGPYPGRVVSVNSDQSVDTSTGRASDAVVREMM